MINFVYEQSDVFGELLNFVECKENNPSGLTRFHPSVLAETTISYDLKGFLYQEKKVFSVKNRPSNYVIPLGVRHHPIEWAQPNGGTNLFSWINPVYLKDMQEGRAIILIDQGLEGYHTPWLWAWFHKQINEFNIPAGSIIYATGNWETAIDYDKWCEDQDITDKIKTIGYAHFEYAMMILANRNNILQDWDQNIRYKTTHKIKTYSCLQKRLRDHRIWFLGELYKADLLECGLVSTNDYGTRYVGKIDGKTPDNELLQEARSLLPLEIYGKSNNEHSSGWYIDRIYDQVYKDSWVSVVSEPIFNDDDIAVFISEKTFKSVACMHPFIILGGRNSLRAMRDMGYKTFSGFIDESYDELSSHDRMSAIISELKRIDLIEDKLSWFIGMKDILEHNYNLFHSRKTIRYSGSVDLINYCRDYWNV